MMEASVRPILEIIDDLEILSASPKVNEAIRALKKANELLNPIYLGMTLSALKGKPAQDDENIFTVKLGDGTVEVATVAQFRELMGDERKELQHYAERFKLMEKPEGNA